jgi:catechol 2,3-dioxygenase-like lactoylglutathione lyase family enzyme
MKRLLSALALFILCATPANADSPPIVGQITFLYYKDLDRAAWFYQRLLGKPPEITPDWVRLFPLTGTATLGLVNSTGGTLRPAAEKPVMVSILVDGVGAMDSWYDRVRAQAIPIAEERKTTRLDDRHSIRGFMFDDPEGYRIEILTWMPSPPAK